jgi:hypothetical protein
MSRNADHALRMLNKLLEEQPERVGHDFSEATRCLSGFRDELIASWRRTQDGADKQRLEQVNAVISVVVGGHFPLGPVPWPEIEKARDLLAKVIESGKANATA